MLHALKWTEADLAWNRESREIYSTWPTLVSTVSQFQSKYEKWREVWGWYEYPWYSIKIYSTFKIGTTTCNLEPVVYWCSLQIIRHGAKNRGKAQFWVGNAQCIALGILSIKRPPRNYWVVLLVREELPDTVLMRFLRSSVVFMSCLLPGGISSW